MENKQTNLEEELKKPLPTTNKRKLNEADLEESETEEFEDSDIKEETKNKIFVLLKQLTNEEIDKNEHLVDMIKKINDFSENQALAYYDMLNVCLNFRRSSTLAKRILTMISDYCVHPKDEETTKEIINDDIIVSSFTSGIGYLISKFGPSSGVLVFLTYIFSSHYFYARHSRKRPFTPSPIQNDGKRQEPNGENDINGKVNEPGLGK